jgi:hypothetical protein
MKSCVYLYNKLTGKHGTCILNKTMNLQYITDIKGRKSAVQLPLKDWKQIKKELEELKRLRNKKLFMTELAEAIEEMKLIKEGKKQARNADDFLNEL